MNEKKFEEYTTFKKFSMTWSILTESVNSVFLNAAFHNLLLCFV